MLDEDVVLKAPRYENERLLLFYIPAILLLPALFGGDTMVAFVLTFSLSFLVPVNLVTYPRNWPDADEYVGRKFMLCISPYLLLMMLAAFRISIPMLEVSGSESNGVYVINETLRGNILSTISTDGGNAIIEILATISVIAAALSIYFITQSRFIVRNIIAICGTGVLALALFGFLTEALFPSRQTDMAEEPFGLLFYASSWSYFAMLWVGAIMGATIYTFQRFKPSKLFISVRSAGIGAALLIAASAVYTATPLHKIFIFAELAIFFTVYAVNVLPTQDNLKRHLNTELKRIKRRSKIQVFIPFAAYSLMTAACLLCAFSSYASYSSYLQEEDAVKTEAYHDKILNDTRELIDERPLFGWGADSFTNAIAFKQGDDIEFAPLKSPGSDILKLVVEWGYVGLAMALILPAFFFIRFILEFSISQSGVIFLTTIAATTVLSIVATPFQSTSVFYSFWILLISFFTWEDAEII